MCFGGYLSILTTPTIQRAVDNSGNHPLQQCYSLTDAALQEALIEVPTIRLFSTIELIIQLIPYKTTILNFRHHLVSHHPGEQFFDTVKMSCLL
jgi:IS5 family transposase